MDELSHETLTAAAQGNVHAFETIYRQYAPFVYNVAYRMVEGQEDAQEITQEIFLIIHRKLGSFLFRSSLKTWIYRITTNYTLNFLNKRNKEQKGRVDFDVAVEFTPGNDDARKHVEQEDQRYKVNKLLALLNPDERACMVLRNVEGLSYEEIAQSLKVNINTVRTRLKRGREKLLKQGREVVADEL